MAFISPFFFLTSSWQLLYPTSSKINSVTVLLFPLKKKAGGENFGIAFHFTVSQFFSYKAYFGQSISLGFEELSTRLYMALSLFLSLAVPVRVGGGSGGQNCRHPPPDTHTLSLSPRPFHLSRITVGARPREAHPHPCPSRHGPRPPLSSWAPAAPGRRPPPCSASPPP